MDLYFDSDVFRDKQAGIYRYAKEMADRFLADPEVACRFVSGRGLGVAGFDSKLHDLFQPSDAMFYEKYSYPVGGGREFFDLRARDRLRLIQMSKPPKASVRYRVQREWARGAAKLESLQLRRKNGGFHFDSIAPVLFGPRRSLSYFNHAFPKPFKVQVVHDLIPKLFPEYCPESDVFDNIFEALPANDLIIAVSESTRTDLLRLAPRVDPDKVHAVHISCSDHFAPVNNKELIEKTKVKYGIPIDSDFVFSLSTIEPRKNHVRLLNAWAKIYSQLQLRNPKLVLAGRKGWGDVFLKELYGKAAQENSVIMTGFVDDDDLPALYSGSVCTVYPSLYEGFGIPVLESMKCGRFCVTSNVSSIPEITGARVPLVDPESVESIECLLLKAANDPEWRRMLERECLERAAIFSWAKSYSKTKELMLRALGWSMPC